MNLTNDILRDAIPHQCYQCTMNLSCDFSCHNIPNPRYIQTESDLGSTSICCQKHGWLPNGYGKKSYKDMTKEEQDVIDSFEGKSSYENVMSNPQVYLGGNQMLQLMG